MEQGETLHLGLKMSVQSFRPKDSIDAIFNPRTVALIGASNKAGKMGYVFMKNLVDGGYQGKIYPVNPGEDVVFGLKAYPSVKEVPVEVDLAVVVVPAPAVPKVMGECSEKGVKAAVVITAGFSEAGEEGKKLEKQLVEAAKKGGVRVVGPNCFGILNCNTGLNASMAVGTPPRGGDISFATQSGAYGMAIYSCAMDFGMRFAKIISYGNKADIQDYEVLRYLGDDPETRVICYFIESLDEGRKFFEEACKVALKKPIVVTKTGRTAGAVRAASSHTAALAGSFTAYETAFKQAGVIFARNGLELVDIAKGLDWQPLPKRNRVGIVTNSGGTGVELTDLCEENGLAVPELPKEDQEKIKPIIPPYASAKNPVDMTPIWPKFIEIYPKIIEVFYESPAIDIVMPILLQRSAMMEDVVKAVRDAIIHCQKEKGIRKPAYVCWVSIKEALKNKEILEAAKIPCYDWPERTARTVGAIYRYTKFLRRKGVDPSKIG